MKGYRDRKFRGGGRAQQEEPFQFGAVPQPCSGQEGDGMAGQAWKQRLHERLMPPRLFIFHAPDKVYGCGFLYPHPETAAALPEPGAGDNEADGTPVPCHQSSSAQ